MDGCLTQMDTQLLQMNEHMSDIEKQQDQILQDILGLQKDVNSSFNEKGCQEGYYKVQLDQIKKQIGQQQSIENKLLRIEQSVLQKVKMKPENAKSLNELIPVISYNQAKCVSEMQK